MEYVVQPGDSLWRIAAARYGDAEKWRAIAEDNHLHNAHRLLIGQRLQLREALLAQATPGLAPRTDGGVVAQQLAIEHLTSVVPARAYLFVLADEVNPLRPKVVRKVMVSEVMAAEYSRQLRRPIPVLPNPERFGLHPTGPQSILPPGRHAMAMKPSPFSSASSHQFGASRMIGSRFWIDVDKAQRAGATFHGTDEILADLDRIAKKTTRPDDLIRIEGFKRKVTLDAEVLIKGSVPSSAVKGGASMAMTRGLQGVQVVGFVMTAVDMTRAVQKSSEQQSIKPVAAESIRQVGGWAAAWAGVKLGAAAGASLGFATGPGAVVTGAIGGVAGGVIGYCLFDWAADHVDEN